MTVRPDDAKFAELKRKRDEAFRTEGQKGQRDARFDLRKESLAEYDDRRARLPLTLRTLVTAAMTDAMREGMPAADCAETVAFAATDLLRSQYGDSQCQVLAQKIVDRAGHSIAGGDGR